MIKEMILQSKQMQQQIFLIMLVAKRFSHAFIYEGIN